MLTLSQPMTHFNYQAKDENGEIVLGSLDAVDRNAALQTLAQRYPLVVQLQEIHSPEASRGFWARGLSVEQRLGVLQQLAAATSAGVPLKKCLDTMAEDCESRDLRSALQKISSALAGGASLSQASTQSRELFADYQSNLMKAGEASGKLPEVLNQLAEELESREHLKSQLRSAITYPSLVAGFALVLTAVLLTWGIPQVQTIYTGMGAQLPLPTQMLVQVGLFLSKSWPLLLTGIGLISAFAYRWRDRLGLQKRAESLLLRLPVAGPLYRMHCIAGFSRTLAMLYRGGLRLDQAFKIAAEAEKSPTMKSTIEYVQCRITQGELLSLAIRSSGFFPALAAEMITTGESSGCLDRMLGQLANFYSRRCELAAKALTGMLEPLLTVSIGLSLGGMILTLALPFLNLPGLVAP